MGVLLEVANGKLVVTPHVDPDGSADFMKRWKERSGYTTRCSVGWRKTISAASRTPEEATKVVAPT